MKILILGAGKMGSFFCDVLSFKHEVAIYDPDPQRLRFTFNAMRFSSLDEVDEFRPQLLINAATVKYSKAIQKWAHTSVCSTAPSACRKSSRLWLEVSLSTQWEAR